MLAGGSSGASSPCSAVPPKHWHSKLRSSSDSSCASTCIHDGGRGPKSVKVKRATVIPSDKKQAKFAARLLV